MQSKSIRKGFCVFFFLNSSFLLLFLLSKQFRDEYAALLEEIKQKRKADAKAYGTIFKKDAAIYQSENVRCFFDIGIGKRVIGRIEMELFCSKVPKTCENFRALCCGEHAGLTYQKTVFHRVIEGFIVQGGDVTMQKGAGGKSIYGDTFEDENFSVDCGRAGVLCMANAGVPNSNQSQFFITLAPCPQLQGQCVAFGRVVAGSAVLKTIAALDVDESDAPTEPVTIVKCGQVKGKDRMVDSSSEDE
jgi:cyclophilin family peptidyl-prolyl cis-trans isomerase